MTAPTPFDAVLGYGSLMNAATHDYAAPRPARLLGWRRVWRAVAGRPAAILSVERAAGAVTLAAAVGVPPEAWPALDAREAAYDRHDAGVDVDPPAGRVALYVVPPGGVGPMPPIRLSYLDVVIQGALRLHGPAGAADVFDAAGWGVVLDDRGAPFYPRARRLAAEETAVVDEGLARLGVPIERPAPSG